MNRPLLLLLLISLCTNLTGCAGALDKLNRIGKSPGFSPIFIPGSRPEDDENHRAELERQDKLAKASPSINSLWQPGANSFFRDGRVRKIGDIIKVTINIQDKANMNNSTQNTRTGKESLGGPIVMGFEKELERRLLPDGANPSKLVDVGTSNSMQGSGQITRQEVIVSEIAAMITKILPNGNFLIQGSQEIRVNYELREVTIKGIVRPQDITSNNEISYDQVAEARISYGGRGNISDVQQPRLGYQILEAVSPF